MFKKKKQTNCTDSSDLTRYKCAHEWIILYLCPFNTRKSDKKINISFSYGCGWHL